MRLQARELFGRLLIFIGLAEGIAVKQPGDLTVEIVKRLVTDVLLVSEGDIEQAIRALAAVQP